MVPKHRAMPDLPHTPNEMPPASSNASSSAFSTDHDIEKDPRVPSSSTDDDAMTSSGFQPVVEDEFDAVRLPYRTLSEQARMGEYLTETPSGLQRVRTTATGREREEGDEENGRDYELVTFVEGDPENPKNWSKAYVLCPLPSQPLMSRDGTRSAYCG